jgi:F-type H+-transporting ATPase subunit c
MANMPNLTTYKALVDWGVTPRYRLRGGFNRAFRAPNLGELFIARTQVFGGFGSADHCSQNIGLAAQPWSASSTDASQAANAYQLCRQLMGVTGAIEYYDIRPVVEQPAPGGTGVAYSVGNVNLREEQADTITLGMVMDFHDNFIGLAGAGAGIGIVFGALMLSFGRNPSLKNEFFGYAILGFALSEATGLFALMIAFLILFS